MPEARIDDVVSVVETWMGERQGLAGHFSKDGLAEFIAVHNARTRQMISLLGKNDPDFYGALLELAQNASTMTAGGKIFVNKMDRTND
jgi:hypothetical protein